MLQKLYSRLHCLVGLLVLVSLAGCETTTTASPPTILQEYALTNLGMPVGLSTIELLVA